MTKTSKMTKTQLLEIARESGARGGRSRSAKKVKVARANIEKFARPGKAVAKLRRDVERKISKNRREWLLGNADERIGLDAKFVKLMMVLDKLEGASNGEVK